MDVMRIPGCRYADCVTKKVTHNDCALHLASVVSPPVSQLYARVFLQILDSSIAEDFTARHVFEDFLKLSEDGIVDMTRQALSRRINCPMSVLNACILKLESPDPASRDQEYEGRRLERLDDHRDWGWRILNWEKYEELRTRADVAIRVARHRKKTKEGEDQNGTYHIHARASLAWLNEKSGHHYRETDPNLKVISARLSEKDVTIDGVKLMIERMVKKWKGTDMADYLRPETLFGKQKFDSYYAAKEQPIIQEGSNHGKPAQPVKGSTPNKGF